MLPKRVRSDLIDRRQVYELFFLEHMPITEISEKLWLTPAAVKRIINDLNDYFNSTGKRIHEKIHY